MDLSSLVAANLARKSRCRMDAAAEETYYRAGALPLARPRLRTLISLAGAAGLFLLLTGIAQA
jgi:hypothetical protein